MTAAEIVDRIGDETRRRIDERRAFGWASFDIGPGPLPRFPLSRGPGLDAEVMERLIADWQHIAEAAMHGSLELLGRKWPNSSGRRLWHLDPVTGKEWPHDAYCFRIPYRETTDYGDVKYVWELNRLQFLQPIAALDYFKKRTDCASFCLAELEGWIDVNPPFLGVNWSSGIELALRVVSILLILSYIDHKTISERLAAKIRSCLAAHAYWLARYPSRHSSANNHLIAEAGALFLLTSVWPHFPGAKRLAADARATLSTEAERQFLSDGVGAEQSPAYTCFSLEWYLCCSWLADLLRAPFPVSVKRRISVAGEFLRWITDEGSNQPRIGDDDEGRVIFSCNGIEDGYVSSVMGCLSAHMEQPFLAPPFVTPRLRNVLFGLPQHDPHSPQGVRSFDVGGYSVFRDSIGGRRMMLVLDHGPVGYLSIAAHGHADALAVWLHIDGRPVIVDSGTYLYHSGREWRDYVRQTAAHNTLTINDKSSSEVAGPFNWRRKARSLKHKFGDSEVVPMVVAEHDGYKRRFGLIHKRCVSIDALGIRIDDEVSGNLTRPAYLNMSFLVHPDFQVKFAANMVRIEQGDETIAILMPGERLETSIHYGDRSPARGWYSPCFGVKVPANQIVFHLRKPLVHGISCSRQCTVRILVPAESYLRPDRTD